MFGRQDDITARDQKAQIDVPLPDDAIAAITSADDSVVKPQPMSDNDFISAPLMQDDDQAADSPNQLSSHLDALRKDAGPATANGDAAANDRVYAPRRLSTTDLLDIKHAALNELSPIIDRLDLKPEEKFRTMIELLQTTDNQALLPTAFNLAKSISNEKVRAEALLAVVNEINYFTRQNNGNL